MKNVFIPEKIGNTYLFPQRILGIDIGKMHINASLVYIKGQTKTLEKCIEKKLDVGTANNYHDRAVAGLKEIIKDSGAYDTVHATISSTTMVFKELKLPLLDPKKISMVIDFEVEPLLPFSLDDAIVDFIVTKQNLEEKSSEILIAAIPKQALAQHLQLFTDAGISPEKITVDFFALYDVFLTIPSYAQKKGGVVLLDVGSQTTRIAYIHDSQLRFIRSLPKGVAHQAKALSDSLGKPLPEIMETLIRFGLDKANDPQYSAAAQEVFTQFLHEITFTLSSFTMQPDLRSTISSILLLGGGSEIKGLTSLITKQIGIECSLFSVSELIKDGSLHIANKAAVTSVDLFSLSAALPGMVTAHFNLRKKEFSVPTDKALITKQLISAAILVTLLFGLLSLQSCLQIRKLNKAATKAELETIAEIKDRFPKISPEEENLEAIVSTANTMVKKDEQVLFKLANPSRIPFLRYLLELTSKIDKKGLNFTIDKLTLTEDTMTLVAQVRDHKALAQLESGLRQSNLFKTIESPEEPSFTMKIMLAKKIG